MDNSFLQDKNKGKMNETGNKYRMDLEEYQASLHNKSGCLLDDSELATKLQSNGFLGEKRNEKNAEDACACLKHPPTTGLTEPISNIVLSAQHGSKREISRKLNNLPLEGSALEAC